MLTFGNSPLGNSVNREVSGVEQDESTPNLKTHVILSREDIGGVKCTFFTTINRKEWIEMYTYFPENFFFGPKKQLYVVSKAVFKQMYMAYLNDPIKYKNPKYTR